MDELTSIIMDNENLIYSIINKFSNNYDNEDLYQVGVIGLIKAYHNYNKEYNVKFTTYAYTYIMGEVVKYINDLRYFKLNNQTKKLYKKINEAKTILTQKLMKEPSDYELSLFLEVDEKTISDIININQTVDSLDREVVEDGKKVFLYDMVGKDINMLDNLFLEENLNKLSKEELCILKNRYYFDMTQQEIAKEMGLSQVKISRSEKKILSKLSKNYQNQ